ncbi:MAG: hypothetical protein HXY40_11900, partial [Chloroflexi bacterium]|nr:hypothetical protein [Chloroflexota bacterium]
MWVNKQFSGFLCLFVLALLLSVTAAFAQEPPTEPLVLQDFEGEVTLEDVYQAVASIGEVAQNGAGALASTSDEGDWHTVGASVLNAPVDISAYNYVCFGVNDTTEANNTVGLKLVDAAGDSTERWTDNDGVGVNPRTSQNEWVTMCLNLMTYTGIDLTAIVSVQFTMFAAGVYYFDDLVAVAGEPLGAEEEVPMRYILTTVQGFEAEDTYYTDYQAEVSLGEVAYSGATSLMAFSAEG